MKWLHVTVRVPLPDDATEEDADKYAEYISRLSVSQVAMHSNHVPLTLHPPLRPYGHLSDWLFEH